ncbi:hypothetical protein KBY31_17120 [Ruegeria pomeroyi]|nr:hypothetical protein [Ruegeria pomeroyi]
MTPEDQACYETARRVVCGDRDEIQVQEDGTFIIGSTAFKLEPSRDSTDALIVATAKMIKLHLGGVDLGKLRDDLIQSRFGERLANLIHDHLAGFSSEDWDAIRARVDFYRELNVIMRLPDTGNSGDT